MWDMEPSESTPAVEVRRSARRRRTITAYREGGRIVVLLPHRTTRAEESRVVPEMVAKVLAKESRSRGPQGDDALEQRSRELVDRYLSGVSPRPEPASVRWVGNQLSRWGSCTPTDRTIRLSDRLRTMPGWVVDYVLLHELVHLVEREHSVRFWELVGHYPRAERARGYLAGWSDAVARQPPVT